MCEIISSHNFVRDKKIAERVVSKLRKYGESFPEPQPKPTIKELKWVIAKSLSVIQSQPILLYLSAPITIIGDIHGQFLDLLQVLNIFGYPPDSTLLFLGDYVDRGRHSIEVISYLLSLKIIHPDKIFLLRGNHETAEVNQNFGFFEECTHFYDETLYHSFNDLFNFLPLAAVVSDRIFCVHGGLSPRLFSLSQISSIKRPVILEETGLVVDLLWSDPDASHEGYHDSERGTSFTFGVDSIDSFLARNNFDLVCRAHQATAEGVSFPFNPFKNCVTLFSAPGYCGESQSMGGLMIVQKDLSVNFHYFEAVDPDEALPFSHVEYADSEAPKCSKKRTQVDM